MDTWVVMAELEAWTQASWQRRKAPLWAGVPPGTRNEGEVVEGWGVIGVQAMDTWVVMAELEAWTRASWQRRKAPLWAGVPPDTRNEGEVVEGWGVIGVQAMDTWVVMARTRGVDTCELAKAQGAVMGGGASRHTE